MGQLESCALECSQHGEARIIAGFVLVLRLIESQNAKFARERAKSLVCCDNLFVFGSESAVKLIGSFLRVSLLRSNERFSEPTGKVRNKEKRRDTFQHVSLL